MQTAWVFLSPPWTAKAMLPDTKPLTVMLVAGEPSGDAIGAELMAALRKARPGIVITGVGGPAMRRQGLFSLFDIADLTVMGIREVLPRLAGIFRRMNEVAAFALRTKPDAVVLIDSGDFNHRVARRIRKRDRSIPLIKYVSPQVWASRPKRARALAKSFDEVLCLLPFEPAFFAQYGLPATFVGHPVAERAALMTGGDALRVRLGIPSGAKLLCVLPGSRRAEIRYLLGPFRETVARVSARVPGLQCVLPLVPGVAPRVCEGTTDWPTPLHIVNNDADKFAAFDAADAALAASGTVATELAVAGCPMIVGYRMGSLTVAIWRRLIKVKYATIANLVLDRMAVPEFLQENLKPEAMAEALVQLLSDPQAAAQQRADLARAAEALGINDLKPATRAAERVLAVTAAKKG